MKWVIPTAVKSNVGGRCLVDLRWNPRKPATADREPLLHAAPKTIMVKTWILATSALALAATLFRRWRRRQSGGAISSPSGQMVSPEWLSNARGQRDDTW
jgi:hypothetical protein